MFVWSNSLVQLALESGQINKKCIVGNTGGVCPFLIHIYIYTVRLCERLIRNYILSQLMKYLACVFYFRISTLKKLCYFWVSVVKCSVTK